MTDYKFEMTNFFSVLSVSSVAKNFGSKSER